MVHFRSMSYLVLARKYRPQDFASVTGQEQVTRTLANGIKRNRVAHAHLFCGPRGVGKTSIARIFAKALNCEGGPKTNPCMTCTNCVEITNGTSLAVREIDGASHNSVDNVRDLIDSFRSLPPPGSKYKVYIIDEVHMLSVSAFNALLKSLEEPPPNTIFILATTEVHKIPETVLSRCVRHEFRALPLVAVQERLTQIAQEEKLKIDPQVLTMIARLSEGSMRDAQTLLERVQSFCDDEITAAEASLVLGSVDRITLLALVDSILTRSPKNALAIVQDIFARGLDPTVLLREFVSIWRELLLIASGVELQLCLDKAELKALSARVSAADLQDLVSLARQGCDSALRSSYVRIAFEALVARLASREPVASVGELMALVRGGVAVAPGGIAVASRGGAGATSSASRPAPKPTKSIAGASSSKPSVPSTDAGGAFSWDGFISSLSDVKEIPSLVRESLKRCTVSINGDKVIVTGQKFLVSGLNDSLPKLQQLLGSYDQQFAKAKIELVTATAAATANKIDETKQTQDRKREMTEEQIANHPALKSIQAMFPGTSIESIRSK